ncbi:S8 family serine peptidase [Acuticoccus sp.]|uniref:S8 family serine peptidase n=1 Tax=Acuticoccus sp. TaxID=1904378 RepID=UPI003B51B7A9
MIGAWQADTMLPERAHELDPACEWALGHGADFALERRERREAEGDFSHLIAVSAAAHGDGWERHTRLVRGEPSGKSLGAGYALAERLVFPAPLRERSIGEAGPAPGWQRPDGLTPDELVVVAVIDDAINVAHERFAAADGGSRVDFAWLQDGVHRAGSGVAYGRELVRGEVEAARREACDEEDALRRLGLLDYARPGTDAVARRAAHGTHILDLAAGAGPREASPNTRIIAVQLPALVTRDTSGHTLGPFFVAALSYVLHRTRLIAAAVGRPVPLVVNFSFGTGSGPHDGGHIIEEAMDHLVSHHEAEPAGGPVRIVVPSGNRNLAAGCAAAEARPGQRTSLAVDWVQPPGDGTSSFLEVWLPAGAVPTLRIAAPGGPLTKVALADGPQVLVRRWPGDGGQGIIARATLDRPTFWRDDEARPRVTLALAPTEPDATSRAPAPSGPWRVEVSAELPAGACIEAWIQRDDAPLGHAPHGRPSTFRDGAYASTDGRGFLVDVDPDAPPAGVVRRAGSLSGTATATAACAVVVGGYVHGPCAARMAPYSATAGPHHRAPDVAAVADRSILRPGTLAAGSRSGSRVALAGTSVAAPLVARWLAERMTGAAEGGVPATDLAAYFAQDAGRSPFVPLSARGGAGALHPPAMMRLD